MKVAILAAGAGGTYCGSCMHDNRLAATLLAQGRDVVLFPLYTPLRTDEPDASQQRVFYGGIGTYLKQISALFRHTPRWVDRVLDAPAMLRLVGRFALSTQPESLGPLTLSVMSGEHGAQRKELEKLIAGLRPFKPDLVQLPNLMFIGGARRLREALGVKVVCELTGEDIFLDRLREPFRTQAFQLIRQGVGDIDAFIALTDYYARHAAEHFGLPGRRVHRITMGIQTADFAAAPPPPAAPFTIGYLSRICPEKGLAALCDAFIRLRGDGRACRLRVAGYLGRAEHVYYDGAVGLVRRAGFESDLEYAGELTREGKIEFLRSLHVLSVPTTYAEAKGLYAFEALAAGVPVVLPNHGSFPELIAATGGGLLHAPGDPESLVQTLTQLMDDAALRQRLAADGRATVHKSFTAEKMANEAWQLYERVVSSAPPAAGTFGRVEPC